MAAAAVLQHQMADIGLAGAIGDAVAAGHHDVLFLESPHHLNADIGIGEHRIEHETVAGVDFILVA